MWTQIKGVSLCQRVPIIALKFVSCQKWNKIPANLLFLYSAGCLQRTNIRTSLTSDHQRRETQKTFEVGLLEYFPFVLFKNVSLLLFHDIDLMPVSYSALFNLDDDAIYFRHDF